MTDRAPLVPEGSVLVHGGCVEILGLGVLLRGESGSGKSDLALRLIEEGAGLVSDDYVVLRRSGDGLRASAPKTIAGLIEVRGVGIVRFPALAETGLGLVLDLVAREAVPRLPEGRMIDLLGVAVPGLALWPFEASATAKIRAWIRTRAERGNPAP